MDLWSCSGFIVNLFSWIWSQSHKRQHGGGWHQDSNPDPMQYTSQTH